jgi:hypothetical protein
MKHNPSMNGVGPEALPSERGFPPKDARTEGGGKGTEGGGKGTKCSGEFESRQVDRWLVVKKRPNPGLGQEQSPKNCHGGQTTPHDKPKAKTEAEGSSDPERTGQRRKARS